MDFDGTGFLHEHFVFLSGRQGLLRAINRLPDFRDRPVQGQCFHTAIMADMDLKNGTDGAISYRS